MYNRQKRRVSILLASDKRDLYGYKSDEYSAVKEIDMAIMLYSQNNTEDVRYKDTTHTALTLDKTLSDKMRVADGDTVYDILLVNNEGRMAQIFLKEVRG